MRYHFCYILNDVNISNKYILIPFNILGYAGVEQLSMCEGNLQLIQSLLDVLHNSAIQDCYSLEICNLHIQSLQLLSVATWKIYPIHIGKCKKYHATLRGFERLSTTIS